jgi:hypothetical protein
MIKERLFSFGSEDRANAKIAPQSYWHFTDNHSGGCYWERMPDGVVRRLSDAEVLGLRALADKQVRHGGEE